ncbi:MAG: LptF/LptG family permease [Phycisphaerales bacterium]|nr:MAG: LptF/LptG family permease [Phycisphaerales bacterium]
MPFPWTLQRYIFREMGKTFLLAAVALTAVLGLGGGVLNMIKLGEATPLQLARLMALLLPLAAALTLPIAALFSATATYGRLSADNEFVACRSSGINLHVLFLPTIVLSLLSAGLSFGLTNYVIPGMVGNLEELIKADIGAIAQQRLARARGMALGQRYRITADQSLVDPTNPNRINLRHIAFVEVDGDEWVRFGTARELGLDFDRRERRIRVSGRMKDLSYYDRKQGQFVEERSQTIPTNEFESPVTQKIKFLNLNKLLVYLSEPAEWYEVREEMERLRKGVGRWMIYDTLWEQWLSERRLTLSGQRRQYDIRSYGEGGRLPREGGIELTDVTIQEVKSGRRRSITAQRATIEVTRGDTIAESGIRIELRDARFSDGADVIPRNKETLGPVTIAPELITRIENLTEHELLHPTATPPGDPLAEWRERAIGAQGETVRRIVGAINERLAFSVSVFALVILGAALGIVFRGSHVMAAFGISFVPLLFVLIMIVMGKQMAHNAATYGSGLLLMWSGIVVVGGLDVWTLTRVLRR